MPNSSENRIGAICSVSGSLLLFVGTFLHPSEADPNEPIAAFTEYAADQLWVVSHLTQFAGIASMVTALLLVVHQMELSRGWAQIAKGGLIASLALAAALQAIDGIALKAIVDRWAAAPPIQIQKEGLFYAAYAVRQVEIGLAALSSLLFGITVTVCGIALLVDRTYPQWLGRFAIVASVPFALSGIVMAFTGFSQSAMILTMPASSVLLIWMLLLGTVMWRQS